MLNKQGDSLYLSSHFLERIVRILAWRFLFSDDFRPDQAHAARLDPRRHERLWAPGAPRAPSHELRRLLAQTKVKLCAAPFSVKSRGLSCRRRGSALRSGQATPLRLCNVLKQHRAETVHPKQCVRSVCAASFPAPSLHPRMAEVVVGVAAALASLTSARHTVPQHARTQAHRSHHRSQPEDLYIPDVTCRQVSLTCARARMRQGGSERQECKCTAVLSPNKCDPGARWTQGRGASPARLELPRVACPHLSSPEKMAGMKTWLASNVAAAALINSSECLPASSLHLPHRPRNANLLPTGAPGVARAASTGEAGLCAIQKLV